MENLIFCLNATIPVFLLMVLGYVFIRIHVFDEAFAKKMNSFVFKIALPVMVFHDLWKEDFYEMWDGRYVLFCFVVTILSIGLAWIVARIVGKDVGSRAEMIQSSYRSSAALLGIGFIQNIYGESGMASLMIIGAVPLYNVAAVAILEIMKPDTATKLTDLEAEKERKKALVKKTAFGIVTNPIIIGIFLGIIWSLLKLPRPVILEKTIKYVGNLATPMGLMALGASFDLSKAKKAAAPAIVASVMKLVVFVAIFLPVAIHMGFRKDQLIAVLIMLGSPTTVSSFVMARNMGHEGTVSSASVMITTLACAFTLTAWLYVIKSLGYV